MPDREPNEAESSSAEASAWSSTPREGEFYFDGPYMVFTEAYHLRRGSCCQSGCRHCPWGFRREAEPTRSP